MRAPTTARRAPLLGALLLPWLALPAAADTCTVCKTDRPNEAEVSFRIATQAPEGTLWLDAIIDIHKTVCAGTKGRVRLTVFPNGTQGDEKAVVEKMGMGVIHGGLFTGIGLGFVLPEVRVLEVPFLYDTKDEIDAVKGALEAELNEGFRKKGMEFLGWAEVGWAYIFGTTKATNLEELRQRKIWLWQGDPLAAATFKEFGLNPVPLSLTDVLTSLNTGMIDSVYNSPYGLVGLQWHSKIKYMSRMTVGHGTGALLVSSEQWKKVRPGWQTVIKRVARQRLDKLLVEIRDKNEQTVKELEDAGCRIIPIPAGEMPEYKRLGSQVADNMVGKLWSKELLAKVRAVLAKARGK